MVEETLTRLRELALAIPRPGCDWEERPRIDPPASPTDIAAIEQSAGFPLPPDYRAFLASTAGVVGMSIHNGYWLGNPARLDSAAFPRAASGEPLAPVATDGGGNAFLKSASGRVWRWDHETGRMASVAASFAEFLDQVAADWSAYVDDEPTCLYLV